MRTLTSSYLDEDELEGQDETWYCVRYDPRMCETCGFRQNIVHITIGETFIITFDAKDDEVMLVICADLQSEGWNPRIVEYHPDFGTSISIYDFSKILGKEYKQDG
jgi:hypothetical protein